jgi:ABC-type sugar transport system ATPase subunit
MTHVNLRSVRKAFGAVEIIKGVDLDIAEGEFCVFVGPSGCGKSTLLRMIAGLEDITTGNLQIGGADMTDVPAAQRGVAMVFQSYALYPHMTVRDNIGFGLRMTGHPRAEIEKRTGRAAEMLQLGALLDRKPSQLSGGQRQRVAIGRAIVREPKVFLFDEPLSNLDAALRVQMRTEIGKLHQSLAATMIYVTHDQVEAMTMADRIVVLNGGTIEQVGSPLELYHRPRNVFVAGFIGSPKMNFLPGQVVSSDAAGMTVSLPGGSSVTLPSPSRHLPLGSRVTLGIRPEHVRMDADGSGVLGGPVRLAEHLGSETMFYLSLEGGVELAVRADGLAKGRVGEVRRCSLPTEACHLFDEGGAAILNARLED